MSLRALTAVWENSKAMGTLLLLELAIADNANDSGLAWPGIDYLARKSRMGRRTVIRLLHELEDTGEILVQRNQGPKGTNLYILPIVTRGATLALVVPPAAPPEGVPPAAPLVSPVALPVPPAAPVPQGGGANGTTELAPEPSGTKTTTTKGDAVEWPSEESVRKYAEEYPGNLAKGIPAIIPERWASRYWGWLTFRVKEWPSDWHKEMLWRFEREYQDGIPTTRPVLDSKGQVKIPGAPSSPPSVWATKQKLDALKTRVENHEANENSAAYCGEPTEAQYQDLERLLREIRECEQQLSESQ